MQFLYSIYFLFVYNVEPTRSVLVVALAAIRICYFLACGARKLHHVV